MLGLLGLVIAGAIAAALFGLPVRTWFEQDHDLRHLDTELAELQSVNAELQRDVDRLNSDGGTREAIREELGYVDGGERRQTALALPDLPTNFPDGWPYRAVEQIIAVRGDGS
jgi:hypothetical protein